MEGLKNFWGSVNVSDGFYSETGVWMRGIACGYCQIIRSSNISMPDDKWSILITSDKSGKTGICIPGCRVKNIIKWAKQQRDGIPGNLGVDIYDVRNQPEKL